MIGFFFKYKCRINHSDSSFITGKPFSASADDDGSNTSKRMTDLEQYNKPNKVSKIAIFYSIYKIFAIFCINCNYILKMPTPSASGNNYIQKWANEMKERAPSKANKLQTASAENDSLKALFSTRNQYPLPASPVIAESSLRQLQQLMYAKQNDPENGTRAIGTLPSKTMETHLALAARESAEKRKKEQKIKADLSDVSIDD